MAESRVAKRARARKILDRLTRAYPDAKCALNFTDPFQLLVATILSAQCTDERVNLVTPALFKKYPSARDLARARTPSLEKDIRSTGFFRAKSRSLLGMARGLVDTHVFRVSQRLGLARSENPDEIHDQLVEVLPADRLTQASHLLIFHGRRTCVARKPLCPVCAVRDLCHWPDKTRG